MFKRWLCNLFGRHGRPDEHRLEHGSFVRAQPSGIAFELSSVQRGQDREVVGCKPQPTGFEQAAAEDLMRICESYWNWLEHQRSLLTQSTTLSERSADELIARADLLRRRVEDVFSPVCCSTKITRHEKLQPG